MEVLSTTAARSDDDIVVSKRKSCQSASRRQRLADSDDDSSSPSKPSVAPSADTSDSEGDSSVKSPSSPSITNTRTIGKHNASEKSDTKVSTSPDSDDDDIVGNKRKSTQSASRRHHFADSDEDLSSSTDKPSLTVAAETSDSEEGDSIKTLTSTSIKYSRAIENQDDSESDKIRNDQNDKKSKLRRRRVICDQSDSDEEMEKSTLLQKSQSQNVRSPSSSVTKVHMARHHDDSEVSDKSESDKDNTKENKLPKKRVITGRSDSYEETQNCTVFQKSQPRKSIVFDSDSDSDNEKIAKPTRVRRKDKMMQKIRKTFKKKAENAEIMKDIMKPLSSICDKESSSEDEPPEALDESIHNIKQSYNSISAKNRSFEKSEQKDDDSKHKRMSAKEAMENMTKIKSESNRMLREKRVTLPYHRPRQVSLKDILSRKRASVPARCSLSFKMNKEQLEQYALQLEESQKQMSELYKSEDEEDEEDNAAEAENKMDADDHFTEISQMHTQSQKVNNKTDVENTDYKQFKKPNSETRAMEIEQTPVENMTVVSTENTETNDIICEETNNLHVNMDSEASSKPSTGTELSDVITEAAPLEKNTELDSQNIHLHFSENTEIDNQQQNTRLGSALEIDERFSKSEENPMNNEKSDDDFEKNKILEISDEAQTNTLCENNSLYGLNAENERDSTTEGISLILDTSDASNKEEHAKESTGKENQDQSNENVGEKSKDVYSEKEQDYSFDDDFPSDDIDELMNQIESEKGVDDSPMLVRDVKPRLHGTPGTVIDLDTPTPQQQKVTGVDLLKQRYIYFSKLRTPEEEEREKELKMKPGLKHLKLKHELERQIAEQSIAEWTKRLEEERIQQRKTAAINGELSDCEDQLEKMEGELEDEREDVENVNRVEKDGKGDIDENSDLNGDDNDNNEQEEASDLVSEEEIDETKKKTIKQTKTHKTTNPLIDDEAEVTDDDDSCTDKDNNDADGSESSDDESSSEEETIDDKKPKKGRIIKAFEDSDDEERKEESEMQTEENEQEVEMKARAEKTVTVNSLENQTPDLFESQTTEGDEDIPLAQPIQSNSEEMNESFTEPTVLGQDGKPTVSSDKLVVMFETQVDMEAIVGMCSGTFPTESQPDLPLVPPSIPRLEGDISTQVIGEDILQLCSGKFGEDTVTTQTINNEKIAHMFDTQEAPIINYVNPAQRHFHELVDPDTQAPKTKKFFGSDLNLNTSNPKEEDKVNSKKLHKEEVNEVLQRVKLVIESSDEENEAKETKKRKKRKKPEKRKLLISDDEEDNSQEEQSALEDNMEEEEERIVEYDSEENEVELPMAKVSKCKRMASDFMEKEAELSSEDEWLGSGDEDERGLDRMEREAGDEDVFHQGQLQRELGQMHMQDLLDQDKREVRMLQEILLEDGDLQGGSRQRKFRWNNADGEEQLGTVPDEFGDTPEEERESEEQWRKQRHERQLFLRQLAEKQKSEDDVLGMAFEETSLVTSSLCLKTVSNVTLERTSSKDTVEIENVKQGGAEKKQQSKDLPSPIKNSFSIMQEQYRSLVSGNARSSLQRLATLVEPASEKPVHNVSSLAPGKQRTFVFATLTQPERLPNEEIPIQKKRKAVDAGTPKLIKKLRVEEKPRKSLLDHLGA